MRFQLGPRAVEAGHRLASFDTIGSTNSEALARLRDGERGPLWVVARAQTAGRGRRDRAWSTANGNLAASLLTMTGAPPARAATLGFVAGLALDEALKVCAPGLSVALKWPNDVLAQHKKLAGILLESEPTDGRLAIVVGIGVNVVSAPQGLPLPAISLASLGRQLRAEHLFAALTDAWVALERTWDGGRGFATIRSRWLNCAFGLGLPVSIRTGSEILHGVFETMDDNGRLILRAADRSEIAISAGDVHFGGAVATVQEVR